MIRCTIVFFACAAMICSSSEKACGMVHGDKELLRLIQTGYTTNLEKISTWRGKARVSVNSLEDGSLRRTMAIETEFVHDASLGATRWSWHLLEGVARLPDGTESRRAPYFKNCMFKDKRFYKFGPFTPGEQQRPYWLVVSPPKRNNISNLVDNFDPLFYMRPPSLNIEKDFPEYYAADETFKNPLYISREGNLVLVDRVNRLDETWRSRYAFDISQGCNLVHYESWFKGSKTTEDYEYQNTDGLFVPRKIVHYSGSAGEHPDFHRQETVFVENIVNKPVDPLEFELAKLGLLPGDTINDKILGVVFKYRTMDSRALDALDAATQSDETGIDGAGGPQNAEDARVQNAGNSEPSVQSVEAGPRGDLKASHIPQMHTLRRRSRLYPALLCVLVLASMLAGLFTSRMLRKRRVQ